MYAVIMAGGSGTRFWPASRRGRPKQFLNICGDAPMVLETCHRLNPVASDEEIILVLGQEHLKDAKSLLKGRSVHIVPEPVGRNTAPCIGLGAIYAAHLGCESPVAFLPADHFIADSAAFLEALRRAEKIAESGGIVTLGIVPTRPETGYGYIERGDVHSGPSGEEAFRVSAFVEKPNLKKAGEYLASGRYFWNAGIFIATPETILSEMKVLMPGLYEGLDRLKRVLGADTFEKILTEVYGDLEAVSFDYGIMEKTAAPVYVVSCACGWSDVGSWASLYELMASEYDEVGNCMEGDTIVIDCERSFVSGRSGRLVACLGLKNVLVVDTEDALLVADLDKSQDIRKIVDELKEKGKEDMV